MREIGTGAVSLDGFLASVERRALRIAQLTTRDADDAMDCVQDSMMQLVRHYADKPSSEWPPLFYRILDNCLRKWRFRQVLRGKWFGRRLHATDEGDDPLDHISAPEAARPDAEVQRAQTLHRVRHALEQLPARQRQAFVLRHWQGLSTIDTAQAMACSEGSVKTHLARAVASLHAQLQQQGLSP